MKQKARQQKPRQPKPAPSEQDNVPEGDEENGSPNKDVHGDDAGDSGMCLCACARADISLAGGALAAGDRALPWLLLWGHWSPPVLRFCAARLVPCLSPYIALRAYAICIRPVCPCQSCFAAWTGAAALIMANSWPVCRPPSCCPAGAKEGPGECVQWLELIRVHMQTESRPRRGRRPALHRQRLPLSVWELKSEEGARTIPLRRLTLKRCAHQST